MAVIFKSFDRKTPYLLPPSIQDYLPEEHLACFVVDIVEQLDLRAFTSVYAGKGKKPYHPAMLIALLFYGYATGTFSSRKLEKASHDSIACRYICANTHPDHDTIAVFRKRFLKELEGLFVDILLIAETMGLLNLGTVSLDGTKIKANASKHKALSWAHANKLEEQLKAEVKALLRQAEDADNTALPEEMDVPAELARREQRLNTIAQAKEKIKARAKERFDREQTEYEEKINRRKIYEKETGKKPKGRAPAAPSSQPQPNDQVNLTDEESRIMPTQSGFEQAYNAQAGVDVETHLIIAQHLTQATNDKQEVESALQQIDQLPASLGQITRLLADTGYHSKANAQRCKTADVEPFIPERRQPHNMPLKERFREDPEAPKDPTVTEAMQHRLQTQEGRAIYSKRKSTVETVFGIIKHVLGFRQFLLRGLSSVQSEWSLVCLGWNLKRIHALKVV
jgi:transposase